MIECNITNNTLKKIYNDFDDIFGEYYDTKDISSLIRNIDTKFKEIRETYGISDTEGIKRIASTIFECADDYDILSEVVGKYDNIQLSDLFSNDGKRIADILSRNEKIVSDTDNKQVTGDIILKGGSETDISGNSDFFVNAYGLATEVGEYAKKTVNRHLVNCMFVGLGDIPGVDTCSVTDNDMLNKNIRAYKEFLFNKVKAYIKSVYDKDTKMHMDDDVRRVLMEDEKLFDSENKSTGAYDILRTDIDSYLRGLDKGALSSLFYDMSNSKDTLLKQNARRRLEAYNAFTFLENFDSYISSLFEEEFSIYNRNTPDVYYALSDKFSKVLSTWREGETIEVNKEISDVVKFIVESIPRLRWNNPQPGNNYIKFGDFQHIVAMTKDLAMDPMTRTIVFDETMLLDYPDLYNSLSDETREQINGKSLYSIISSTKTNPREKWVVLFALLGNELFRKKYKGLYSKNITLYEADLIYSLSLGLFNGPNSIYAHVDPDAINDYFGHITQSAEAIYGVKYIQLYRDEDGILKMRRLSDLGLFNIRQKIELTINNANSKNILNWSEYSTFMEFTQINDGKGNFIGVQFKIPNTKNVYARVDLQGNVKYYQNDKEIGFIFTENDVLPFIDKILKLNFKNNTLYKDFYKEILGNDENKALQSLTEFAARVVMNQYVSNVVIQDKEHSPATELSHLDYGEKGAPKFNNIRLEMELIHPTKDIPTLINLSIAKANSLGMIVSTHVKNADGNSLSQLTFDRLVSNFNTLFDVFENREGSTTNHFSLLKKGGLLSSIFFVNEFYDKAGTVKPFYKMSVNELSHSQLIYSYISGLVNANDEGLVKNGDVLVYPCVMGDRAQFPVLGINTNIELECETDAVDAYGNHVVTQKQLKQFTNTEIRRLISKELGEYYRKQYNNVVEDWRKFDDIVRSYFEQCFNEFNKANEEKGIQLDKTMLDSLPSFADDYIHDFENINNWFKNPNIQRMFDVVGIQEKDIVDFIRARLNGYNNNHLNDILKLTNQIHYKFKREKKGSTISTNRALIAQIARHLPNTEIGLRIIQELTSKGIKYYTADEFWNLMRINMIESMLRSSFRINTSDTSQKELNYLRKTYPSWINGSGDMYVAKITVDAIDNDGKKVLDENKRPVKTTVGISTRTDMRKFLSKYGIKSLNDINPSDIELNPIIERYNYYDYFASEEWLNSTIGTFASFSEKSKNKTDILALESAHIFTANKRYMTFAASLHSFHVNTLNGIPGRYRIAIIEELMDEMPLITGGMFPTDASNAATWVNPMYVYLENNSLPIKTNGITKKPYIHFRDFRTGTSGMIKTASFGLSNNSIRNSFVLLNLMRKMTDFVWRDQTGNIIHNIDLLHDYNGNRIGYDDLYFKDNGKYYKILDIQKVGDNLYKRKVLECDKNGVLVMGAEEWDMNPIEINSNYKLWLFLGGKNSMELDEQSKSLVWSENSIKSVVSAMNKVGIRINNKQELKSQDDLFQPLKHSDIAYVTTEEAVKYGQGNLNSADRMRADDNTPFDTFYITLLNAGIQLDKEHAADESELSLPTLVVNACGLLGYTTDLANNLYTALLNITNYEIGPHAEAVSEMFNLAAISDPNQRQKILDNFREVVMKNIVKGINKGQTESTAKTIVREILNEVGDNPKYSDLKVPLSDNTVLNKVITIVSSTLTSMGIKMKMNGLLSVLSPSYTIFKLYADRKLESFDNFDEEIAELQKKKTPVYSVFSKFNSKTNNIGRIELGRHYIVRRLPKFTVVKRNPDGTIEQREYTEQITENIYLRSPQQYRQLRYDIEHPDNKNGMVLDVVENLREGRELAGYNVYYRADDNKWYQLWDLDSANALFEADEMSKNAGTVEDFRRLSALEHDITGMGTTYDPLLSSYKKYADAVIKKIRRVVQKDLANLSNNGSDYKSQINVITDEINNKFNTASDDELASLFLKYTRFYNIIFGTGDGDQIRLGPRNLYTLNKNNFIAINRFVQERLDNLSKVRINGKYITVDKNSVDKKSYEAVMNKVYQTKFGLDQFADLNEIEKDKHWFVKQYIKNYSSKIFNPLNYTVEFKSSNGNHTYVLHKDALRNAELYPLYNVMYVTENGKKYRVNSIGEKMYEIVGDTKIYTDEFNNEVIVTDNMGFYADELSYDAIKISSQIDLNTANILINGVLDEDGETLKINGLKNCNTDTAIEYADLVSDGDEINDKWLNTLKLRNNNFHNEIENLDSNDNNAVEKFIKSHFKHSVVVNGINKHTSFLRSLDLVAARIPAQCFQSFMPMRVVAFDNPDLNNVYVSTYQILLLGSDFDIDTVSLVNFDIDRNGLLRLWSPYASLLSNRHRIASEKLPFPTGKKIELQRSGEESEMHKTINFLNKYIDIFNIKYDKKAAGTELEKTKYYITPKTYYRFNIEKLADFLNEINDIKLPIAVKIGEWLKEFNDTVYPRLPKKENNKILPDKIQNEVQFIGLLRALVDVADRHNMYLSKIPQSRLIHIENNYAMRSMYDIIADPINLLLAQVSVDVCTGPLKKTADDLSKDDNIRRGNGNMFAKFENMFNTLMGKQGVGIFANGIKGFEALTQCFNMLLNYGTEEEQQRLLTKPTGIQFGDKTYSLAANIRAKNLHSIKNDKVLEALAKMTQDVDAAIQLSAMMSLAVDNAKELSLYKLNAGERTMGLFIYGLVLGIDFDKIAEMMTSQTGKIILHVAENNVFTDSNGFSKIPDAVNYFKNGIKYNNIRKYDIKEISGVSKKHKKTILETFKDNLRNNLNEDLKDKIEKNVSITSLLNQNFFDKLLFDTQIRKLDELRGNAYVNDKPMYELYNQFIDYIEEYATQRNIVKEEGYLDLFETLGKGALEMFILGRLLAANKGALTSLADFLKQIYNVEHAVSDKTGKKEDDIDLGKFCFDEEYRQQAIKKYEEVKDAFNILDIISKVPHFMGYLQTIATIDQELNQMFNYRSIRTLYPKVKKANNIISSADSAKLIRGIQSYLSDYLLNTWMYENAPEVTITAGNFVFDKLGNKTILKEDTRVRLGTDWTNATFKAFVEREVIPNLQNGIISNRYGVLSYVADNEFVKNLEYTTSTRTVSKNQTSFYTLPINMLPRGDLERYILNKLIMEFNKLGTVDYQWDNSSMPVVDMLTLYSMISNNWRLAETSLVPIFDSFQNLGLLKSFHDFVSEIDRSGNVVDIGDNVPEEMKPYIALWGNKYRSYQKWIFAFDYNDKVVKMWENREANEKAANMDEEGMDFVSEEEMEQIEGMDEDEEMSKPKRKAKYVPLSIVNELNYLTRGRLFYERNYVHKFIDDLDKEHTIEINYNIESESNNKHKITSLKLDGAVKQIPGLEYLPMTKVYEVDKDDEGKTILKMIAGINTADVEKLVKLKMSECI